MRIFFAKSGLLVLLVLLTCAALFLSPLPYNHELAAIVNKIDMLKREGAGRVIFVGGSGLYDGLDSGAVQTALGRPVVNLGLYGGFGIASILHEIGPLLRRGDLVVLMPEYGVLIDPFRDETRKWLFALSPFRSCSRLYDMRPSGAVPFLEDFFSLLRSKMLALPKLAGRAFRRGATASAGGGGYVLYHDRFDPFGDSRRPFRKVTPERIEGRGIPVDGGICGQTLSAVNDFHRLSAARGAGVVFVFPAYPREEFVLNRDTIKRYERYLRATLEFPVLGRPEDFLFPLDQFTNTVNHLTAEGKAARTSGLIGLLSSRTAPTRRPSPALSP